MKVSASRKCLPAKNMFLLVEKGTTPTKFYGKHYMANHVIWLLGNGKLWERWQRKTDSSSDGDRDNNRDSKF